MWRPYCRCGHDPYFHSVSTIGSALLVQMRSPPGNREPLFPRLSRAILDSARLRSGHGMNCKTGGDWPNRCVILRDGYYANRIATRTRQCRETSAIAANRARLCQWAATFLQES